MVGAWDSASQITADFRSGEPEKVAASFYPETFPGESSTTSDLAWGAAKSAAQAALFGGAGKYFGGQLSGELAGVPKGTVSTSASGGKNNDPVTGLLNTQLANDAKSYLTDIQNLTGR